MVQGNHKATAGLQSAQTPQELLADCALCPRSCHVNRLDGVLGVCRTGRHAVVSSYFAHHGEEKCLRGWRGSGTIFFAWCNLRCVFCQNHDLSWEGEGQPATDEELARMMLQLQAQGCHNINLVTPSHVVPQVLEAVAIAEEGGLTIPLVFNSSGYDLVSTLRLFSGVVDIYMPDFKFWTTASASRYASAPNYPAVAREAILEMYRQVGPLVFDEKGLAVRGLLIRHLVMPELVEESRAIVSWIAETLGPGPCVNVMAQYHPSGQVSATAFPEIDRRLYASEFSGAVAHARSLGLRLV